MMRCSLILLVVLPLSLLGQGFILVDSFSVSNVDLLDVINIDSYYDQNHNGFVYTTTDSVVLVRVTQDGIITSRILTSSSPNGFEISSLQSFNDYVTEYKYTDEFILYDLNSGNAKEIKKFKPKRHKSIEYSFQDNNYLYLISYYNRLLEDKSKSHDLVYFYKLSKKSLRLVKSASFNIDKEIILAPFNHQLISFNQDYFLIADRIGHKLLKVSKDLKLCDTAFLNQPLGLSNWEAFNNTFPDENVKHYLHKPKMVIDHFSSSEDTKNLKTIFKTFFLNDSSLAVVYKEGIHPSYTFELEVLNINSQEIIYRRNIPFRGDELSPFAWTRKIYTNNEGHFLTISLGQGMSAQQYTVKIWEFSNQKSVSTEILTRVLSADSSFIEPYSGVILADEYFCKGCYGSAGTGVGVLVISKAPDVNSDLRDVIQKKQKRDWKINGDLIFVDSSIYDELKTRLQLNYLTPLVKK